MILPHGLSLDDSIGLGLSSQAEQIRTCIMLCVFVSCVFPFDFHPESPRVLRVHRPHERIREDRATNEAIRQLVASSSGIRAQGTSREKPIAGA